MNMYRHFIPIIISSTILYDNYLYNVHIVLGIINNLETEVHERIQIDHEQKQWQFIESRAFLDLGICRMS